LRVGIFCVLILAIAAGFLFKTAHFAKTKGFWVDETYGLEMLRKQSFMELIIDGAESQFSRSPLHYIFYKTAFNVRWNLGQVSRLADPIYYRLLPCLWVLLSGLIMAAIFFRKNIEAMAIVPCALVAYYFNDYISHFAAETRPYALWFSLILVAFVYFMRVGKINWVLCGIFTLFAFTSVGALTVMGCFGLSCLICRAGKFKDLVVWLALPVVVCLYYIWKQTVTWDYQPQSFYFSAFYKFWVSSYIVPIISVTGIVLTYKYREFRPHTAIFLTMLILYFISPLTNYVVIKKYGSFFHPRYYIYYNLIIPLFLISLSSVIPRIRREDAW